MEWRPSPSFGVIDIEKGAFGSPSTKVANFPLFFCIAIVENIKLCKKKVQAHLKRLSIKDVYKSSIYIYIYIYKEDCALNDISGWNAIKSNQTKPFLSPTYCCSLDHHVSDVSGRCN